MGRCARHPKSGTAGGVSVGGLLLQGNPKRDASDVEQYQNCHAHDQAQPWHGKAFATERDI
jgi:hypothetical protein